MPDDDGGKPLPRPPEPGVPARKQGRPPKDLSKMRGAQRQFADIIRKEFFDRLADLGVTTAQISAALGEGFSGPSLSKYRAGERVPDRDKLLRLLAYAEERVGQPLGDGVREHVLEKYSAALRETNPQLHRFYELMDEREQAVAERDEARGDHARAREELVQCQESLEQALRLVGEMKAEAQRAEQEELRRRRREKATKNEIVRLREKHDELLRAVRGARAGQQAARKEIRRLEDLLVQQGQETARSEAALKAENTALAAEVSAAAARVAELERAEQALRGKLEQVTTALEQAEARNSELASQHAVVLRSRAVVSQRLSQVRRQRSVLEEKLAEATQKVSACMRQLTAAERRVARAESELVAVYRSRDALLDDPTAPGQAVTDAVEAVDAAWQSYEVEISRIEQQAVVPPEETTAETSEELGTAPEPILTSSSRQTTLDTAPERASSSGPVRDRSTVGPNPDLPAPEPEQGATARPPHQRILRSRSAFASLSRAEKRYLKELDLWDDRRLRRLTGRQRAGADRRLRLLMILAVRAVALLLGLTACVLGVMQAIDGHKKQFPERYASPCPSGSAQSSRADCVSRETGRVENKTRDEKTARLIFSRSSGKKQTVAVNDELYEAVRPGSPAELAIWKDRIVKISIAGRSDTVRPGGIWMTVLWVGLLIGLGAFIVALALKARAGIPWVAIFFLAPFSVFWTGLCSVIPIGTTSWWGLTWCILFWLPGILSMTLIVNKD